MKFQVLKIFDEAPHNLSEKDLDNLKELEETEYSADDGPRDDWLTDSDDGRPRRKRVDTSYKTRAYWQLPENVEERYRLGQNEEPAFRVLLQASKIE